MTLGSLLKLSLPQGTTGVVLLCPCCFWRLSLPQTHNETVPTETCNWAVLHHFSCPWLPGLQTSGHKHVWPCGFYHCHKQTGCWLTATCLSELVHKHINSITHTLWQQTLDSSNIFRLDKQLDQPESEGQLPFVHSIRTKVAAFTHSQACFYREPGKEFVKNVNTGSTESDDTLKRCFSFSKCHQWKACM